MPRFKGVGRIKVNGPTPKQKSFIVELGGDPSLPNSVYEASEYIEELLLDRDAEEGLWTDFQDWNNS